MGAEYNPAFSSLFRSGNSSGNMWSTEYMGLKVFSAMMMNRAPWTSWIPDCVSRAVPIKHSPAVKAMA